MNRDPDSVELEALYLRELNLGLQELLERVGEAAREVAAVPIALLALVMAPPSPASVDAVSAHGLATLAKLAEAQAVAIRLGELVGGRILTLRAEAGLEDAPDA